LGSAYEEALAQARGPYETSLTRGFKALETAVPTAASNAERNARTALKIRRADADPWFLLALSLRRQGKASAAAAALKEARRREPNSREYRLP
jgi:cytochrome c-type biogenesis protein CcmH/NrfG